MGTGGWDVDVLDVLGDDEEDQLFALPLKLTDSSLKALQVLLEGGKKSGEVEIGEEGNGRLRLGPQDFNFTLNSLNLGEGGMEIIQALSSSFRRLHRPTQRIQISATEDSFADARARTKAMLEEEAKKAGKEVRHKNSTARTSARLPPSIVSNSAKPSQSVPSNPRPSFDYSKKSLRERILHLLATNTLSKEALLDRLKRQEAGSVDKDELTKHLHELANVRNLLDERSNEKTSSFFLRNEFFKECDLKWPGFTSFDRQLVLKKLKADSQPSEKPSSGTGKTRVYAGRTEGRQNESSGQKRKPLTEEVPSVSPPLSIPDDPPQMKARVAHSSQPESKTQSLTQSMNQSLNQPEAKKPRPSPPSDPTELPQPPDKPPPLDLSKLEADFQREFPAINSMAERRTYHAKFNEDYKEYWRCYERLNKVAQLFDTLEQKLRQAEKEEKTDAVESEIEKYYRQYVTDPKFIQRQRQHQKLRQKLAVLKARIQDFDQRYAAQNNLPLGVKNPPA